MTAYVATTTARPWRLGARTRKGVLLVHIMSAGAWFGLDLAMAALVFTAVGADDPGTKAFAYRALELFAIWPLFTSGVVCLASGVLLGLGSKFGLVRYWWVTLKLALNILLTTLVLFALRPQVVTLAEQGEQSAAGQAVDFLESSMLFPPLVSSTALLIAFTLSVFKPWGRIRRGSR
ncbi:MAG: hypothetical protein GEU80_12860 [Dehalococcoidia bacterium]|nr:hypothetical protein [Dehalococcoidia bacterium]